MDFTTDLVCTQYAYNQTTQIASPDMFMDFTTDQVRTQYASISTKLLKLPAQRCSWTLLLI